MENLTVEEIKKLRISLQTTIEDLIIDFENSTNCFIEEIKISRFDDLLPTVNCTVKI